MVDKHVWKAFDRDLEEIGRMVLEMGGLVERQAWRCVESLSRHDSALAGSVVTDDDQVDQLQAEIERKSISTIALRQPVAGDLRELVGAMRIASDLERAGDLAKNIAKRVIAMNGEPPPAKLIRGIEHQNELVLGQLKAVLDAYARRSLSQAMAVWAADEEVDAICTSVFRELLTYMMGDPRTITACTHLLFMAKNIERAGDHVTNIAELVSFRSTGQSFAEARRKGSGALYTTDGTS